MCSYVFRRNILVAVIFSMPANFQVLIPYFEGAKKSLGLPATQKSLLIWDAFKAHGCESVRKRVEEANILTADIPANLTHLLSPLDLTVNKSIKLQERQEFTDHFTKTVQRALEENPNIDVADIKLDTRKTVMRPLHARSLCKVHAMFKTDRGKQIILNGWRAAGIVDAVKDARTTVTDILDPFAELTL